MVKVLKSIIAALLLAVMICGCSNGSSGGGDSSDGNSSSLVGTVWTLSSVKLYFYEDGVCSLVAGSAQPGTYDESTKTIHITSPVSIYYTYEISGDTMILSKDGKSIYLKKQG